MARSQYDFLLSLFRPFPWSAPLRYHYSTIRRSRSSFWIKTTSPTLMLASFLLSFMLCRSRSSFMYSLVHWDHTASLSFRQISSRFLSSTSSIASTFSSGHKLGCINIEFGVKNWTSSSRYPSGRLFTAISTSSSTSSSSDHSRFSRPILLCNAFFTRLAILSNWSLTRRSCLSWIPMWCFDVQRSFEPAVLGCWSGRSSV